MKILLAAFVLAFLLFATRAHAQAVVTPPCTPSGDGGATINVIAVQNGAASFCVSDFGNSDTQFYAPIPADYDQSLDVLSGDNAHNLKLLVDGQPAPGTGWLSPYLDAGNFVPIYATGSPWQVIVGVHYVDGFGTTMAESQIMRNDIGLAVKIDTQVYDDASVVQWFQFANTGPSMLTSLQFTSYFNFHPTGSLDFPANTVQMCGDDALIQGSRKGTWIADGKIVGFGQGIAAQVDLGASANVVSDIEQGAFNGLMNWGTGDAAAGHQFLLPDLSPGDSRTFGLTSLKWVAASCN